MTSNMWFRGGKVLKLCNGLSKNVNNGRHLRTVPNFSEYILLVLWWIFFWYSLDKKFKLMWIFDKFGCSELQKRYLDDLMFLLVIYFGNLHLINSKYQNTLTKFIWFSSTHWQNAFCNDKCVSSSNLLQCFVLLIYLVYCSKFIISSLYLYCILLLFMTIIMMVSLINAECNRFCL